MDPPISHIIIHVINNCADNIIKIVTFVFLCFDVSFIKFFLYGIR